MKIGNREFTYGQGHVYIMGILNVTPDSFSDGGKFNDKDAALFHVEEMVQQGADIIDVGGESTRPGYQKITVPEEIERVTGIIEAVKKRFDIPVSIDTYKAPVMDAALAAGALEVVVVVAVEVAVTAVDTPAVEQAVPELQEGFSVRVTKSLRM